MRPGRNPKLAFVLTRSYWTLVDLLAGRRAAVLTGAGCSTESGIPDYRGPDAPKRKRDPIRYREFVGDEAARRRYWSRSMVGWPTVNQAQPNQAHLAIARLEHAGLVSGVITQNVDGLHDKAGSRNVVELHGNLDRVEPPPVHVDLPAPTFRTTSRESSGPSPADDAAGCSNQTSSSSARTSPGP